MKVKYILALSVALMPVVAAFAGGKKAIKPKKADFKLIEAYRQNISGGAAPTLTATGEHIIVSWKVAEYPATFYWRGEKGFMMCSIKKAHKINGKEAGKFPPGMVYRTEETTGDGIHKGDTLEIMPVANGKVRIPDDIPQNAKNTLFYKVSGNDQWRLFPVTKITKKKAIITQ